MTWASHLAETRKKNPKLSMSEAMKKASTTYKKKQKGGCDGKPCAPCTQKGKGPKLDKVKGAVRAVGAAVEKVGCAALKKLGKTPKRCQKYSGACTQLCKEGITSKRAYMQWALKNHPDKGGNEEEFKRVNALKESCVGTGLKAFDNLQCGSGQKGSGPYINNAYTPSPDGTKIYLTPNYQNNSYFIPGKYDIAATGYKPFTLGS